MPDRPPPHELSAAAAAAAIARGDLTSVDLVESCLERIESRDALVGAWAYVDANQALAHAREADAALASAASLGVLHGVPVGIKDIFDTADMPTECGSALYRDRRPTQDAAAVAMLRNAGAIVIGKTVTAELALSAPGATANPLDLRRTPGGSSSGSAAAVADHMVPVAIGSQTVGSVIRPASFCGIVGFKPSFDAIPVEGMLSLAPPLDHAGLFARDLADAALVASVLIAGLAHPAGAAPPPRVGVVRAPVWREASSDARFRFDAWASRRGFEACADLGDVFEDVLACQRTILDANLAASMGPVYGASPGKLRAITRKRVRNGLTIGASAYIRATARVDAQRARLDQVFHDFDALLTLAAPGEAPLGLSSTGNAVFSAIWTLMGTPVITIPLLEGENGLPIGVQIIGAPGTDAKLFAAAARIMRDSSPAE